MSFPIILGKNTCQPLKRPYDMSMSLTKDDLKAVKQLIDGSIDSRVQPMLNKLEKRLVRKFDGKIDGLTLDIAKFSHETTDRFNKLESKFDDLSEKLASTTDMTDYNRVEIRKLKRKLGLI